MSRHKRQNAWQRAGPPPSPIGAKTLWAMAAFFTFLAVAAGAPRAAEPAYQFAKPISSQLNPTGRALTIMMPLKDGDVPLGEVLVRINPDDTLLINAGDLKDRLNGAIDPAARARLEQAAEPGAFVSLAALKAAGIVLSFDPGLQELKLEIAVEQRPLGDISFLNKPAKPNEATLASPAKVAGYVNVTAGLDHAFSGNGTAPDSTSGRLELESALRMHGAVFENRALYEGDVDANICPTGAKCVYQHQAGLKRESSRLVYDSPEHQLRFEFGDTDAVAGTLQRSMEMLGISVEKSATKLAPGETTAPAGRTSLRIERPSEIDVTVNGATVQHLHLRPGTYNLRDLPLATGANDIKLIITDDTGQRRTEAFTTYSAANQLAAGSSAWAVSAGIPSYLRDNSREYIKGGDYSATSFLRYGLTDSLAGEANLQGDKNVIMGSSGIAAATPFGVFGLQGASSFGRFGTGVAADANWDLINFGGLLAERGESLHLGAEYRSRAFHRPGDLFTTATGILYPEFNYWLRVSASYSTLVGDGLGLTLSGRYQFADDGQAQLSPFTIKGDRYGADLTLSRSLSATMSGSLLVGYSNESYLRDAASLTADAKPDVRFSVRLNVRPDEKTTVSANYDSLNRQSTVSAYHSEGNGVGRWDTNLDLQQLGATDSANANAALGYYGNRGEAHLSYNADVSKFGLNTFDPQANTQRASLRGSTAFAFADGAVAVGPPIRGGAFAIVYPHESIAGKAITVGDAENPRAFADSFGPAIVTDLPAYAASNVVVDVADLPAGYSLGAGAFDLKAGYKAGYALEVGSAYSVSVYGTLLDQNSEAVSLVTGYAQAADQPSKRVAIFTNAAGKFGAEGLAPGHWIIEMATEGGPLRFSLDVPKGVEGLHKAGVLRPMGAAP